MLSFLRVENVINVMLSMKEEAQMQLITIMMCYKNKYWMFMCSHSMYRSQGIEHTHTIFFFIIYLLYTKHDNAKRVQTHNNYEQSCISCDKISYPRTYISS